DAPALGLPRPAHQHALAGNDRSAIRQVHRAQHFSGEWAGLKRATQRDADQLATELLGRDGFGHGGARNTRQQADEHNDGQTDGHESTHGSYNIEGSTRSGGLWPSMNVLMLMMTFSPMSIRPSMVAEPMCGSSTTFPERASRTSLGLTAGSCS